MKKARRQIGNPELIHPLEIQESLRGFREDHPDPTKVAFVMMKFGTTPMHTAIVEGIRLTLSTFKMTALRADDKQYHDDLLSNILTYIYGSAFGIAVFERIEGEEFNPNVSLEVGYMFAIHKPVCLLRDRTLRALHADLVGKLYRTFDPHDPRNSIPEALLGWLRDKRLVGKEFFKWSEQMGSSPPFVDPHEVDRFFQSLTREAKDRALKEYEGVPLTDRENTISERAQELIEKHVRAYALTEQYLRWKEHNT